MQLNPHLSFDGRCEEAFRFYAECLGGEISMMRTHGDSPLAAQTPPPWRGKILHATLALGDQTITGGDVAPGQYCEPRGIDLLLHADTPAEAERIFAALAENGEVRLPLQETFWTARFGMLIDRFGIPWMIGGGKPADVNPVF